MELNRLKKAQKELTRSGQRVLLADPDEKKKIKQRLIFLANTEKDKKAKRILRNGYRTIKV